LENQVVYTFLLIGQNGNLMGVTLTVKVYMRYASTPLSATGGKWLGRGGRRDILNISQKI